ncbi:MAG: preprotein translocase subunit SecE [Coriobacteriia bacterium]|nr:preprotein translocase subunit SecE [Coriobacteriia bacterium]
MAKGTTPDKPKSAEKSAKQAKLGKSGKPNVFARLVSYVRDVRSEMKRVVWPSRSEVLNSSVVVITTLLFFIVFIAATDFVVVKALGLLSKIGG